MDTKTIVELLQQGKKPIVKLTNNLWDDSWGEKGMIARIVSFKENHCDANEPMVSLMFDYNEHKDHNLALQSHTYFLNGGGQGTAFEAGRMKEDNIHESVYFMMEGNGSDVPVDMITSPLLDEFAKSKTSMTYVEWLENELTKTRSAYKDNLRNEITS